MARQPPNLDNLMNEGIAFIIERYKSEIPDCPVGKRPVMIGRRKAAYDTIDSDETTGLHYQCHVSHEFYYCGCTIRLKTSGLFHDSVFLVVFK